VTFTAMGTAGAPRQIAIDAGNGQQAPAGTAVPIPPSVIVRDQFNNPVPAVAVTFAVGLGGGAVNPTTPLATGPNGIAAVTSWTLGTIAGPNTLTATAPAIGVIGNQVTFTATGTPAAPSSSQSSVSAPATPITASNGTSVSTITATVRDGFGNPVGGATVTLASLDPGTSFTQPSGTTATNGQIAGPLSATVAGTKSVTATVNSTVTVDGTATVTVDPAAPATLSFSGQPSNATTGNAIAPPVVVTAQDEFGNPTPAFIAAIALSITPGTGTVLARLDGTNPLNAVGGVATFSDLRINLPSTVVPYRLDAASGSLTGATSSAFDVTGLPLP